MCTHVATSLFNSLCYNPSIYTYVHAYILAYTYVHTIDIILKVCTDNFPYWLHYLQAGYVSRLKFLARATGTIADTPIEPILYIYMQNIL